nr:nitrile hydratase subunit beta [Gammaproteobacteria bacterium]
IESMTPAEYLSSSYYQKWLHARIETLVAKGAISRDELDARIALLRREPGAEFEGTEDPEHLAKVVARTRHEPAPSVDTDIEPEFAVGDVVQVRNIHPAGHTRLPRYVRGKLGQIVAVYGVHWLQDELPADSQPRAEAVYSMRFDAQELWGDAAPSQDALYIDMWESYLEDPTTEGR